jgi:hypothetical protein
LGANYPNFAWDCNGRLPFAIPRKIPFFFQGRRRRRKKGT